MKKTNRRNKTIIGLILLLFCLITFYKSIFDNYVFAWYNDQLFQHNVFYQEWYRIIEESISTKTLAVYSWNTFLGTDYLATKLMYCVGDFLITPYFILRVLLCGVTGAKSVNFDQIYAITTSLSIVLSGINMSIYLDALNVKKRWLYISLSIAYALGGFACIYTGSYMFHRFYTLLPLLFYFTEEYLINRKTVGFTIVTALLFMQSYELLFSTCFFLVLYFVISEKLKKDISLKEILKKSISLICSFLIGIMLCGVFLVPLILYLKTNSRVGFNDSEGLLFEFKAVLGFITNAVLPTFNLRSNEPLYLFNSNSYYVQEYGYFITLIFLLAFIQLLKKGNKKEKILLLTGEIAILICILIKPINSIIHGFSVPTFRWSFVLAIYHAFVTAHVFEKYQYDNSYWKELLIINLIYIGLYVAYVFIYKIEINSFLQSILINIGSFVFVYLFDIFLSKEKYKAVTALIILNVMIFYTATLAQYGIYEKGQESYNQENIAYHIYCEEDQLSRYYFDSEQIWPYAWLNLNNSIVNDYCGVSTYDSTYQSVLSDFLGSKGYSSWMVDIEDYDVLNMLGVKYYVLSEDTKLLNEIDYKYVTNFDNYKVYEDKNSNHIAYTVSSFTYEESNDISLGNELIILEKDYEKISDITQSEKIQMDVLEYSRQHIKGSIEVNQKTVLFVAIPYSSGWNVLDQNNRKLETINVNNGFLGVIVDENVENIYFYYQTPGLKPGLLISAFGVLGLVAEIVKEKRKKTNKITI